MGLIAEWGRMGEERICKLEDRKKSGGLATLNNREKKRVKKN